MTQIDARPDSPPTPTKEEKPHADHHASPGLLRALGPMTAVCIVVGQVIGSGIFLKPGTIAADSGDFRLIISVWIAGGVLCMLGAFSLAELGAMHPHAGGLYVFLREAYGRPVAFLFGWNDFLFRGPGSIGALSVAFTGSLLLATQWQPGPVGEVLLAIGLIVGLMWVNILGVIWGGHLQNLTTWIKGTFLALVGLLPFLLLPFGNDAFDPANYNTTVTPRVPTIAGQFGLVLLAVMWAYNGWHGVTYVAEEIKQPQRNVPRALVIGIGILTLLYVGANVAYYGVLTMPQMAAAGDHAAERMVETLLGRTGSILMSAFIMCSTFGALNANLLLNPRIAFAMGRDRVFFKTLGHVHANYRTPSVAILTQAALAVVLVLVAAGLKYAARDVNTAEIAQPLLQTIVVNLQEGTIFNMLTDFVIFAASIFYLLAVGAVIVLRFRQPDTDRPYRTLGYPVTPLVFVVVYVWFLGQVYSGKPLEANAGLVLIGAGIVFYAVWTLLGLQKSPPNS